MTLLLLSMAALAFESDQLQARTQPPEDALQAANAQASHWLAQAIQRANHQVGCAVDDETMRHELARQIHRIMGGRVYVPSRDEQPPMGFGAYAAWLETGPIDRVSYSLRQDVYAELSLLENPILSTFGPASTLRFGPWLLGTDKIDHFWIQGYDYYQRSRQGLSPERAIEWGTRTERGIWGLFTTGVFSFADLAANYDGMRFYLGLLGPESVVGRDEAGCATLRRPFDWLDWVDWRYDEVLNPSLYRVGLARSMRDRVQAVAPWLCTQAEPQPAIESAPWIAAPALPDEDRVIALGEICQLADTRSAEHRPR